MPTRCRDGVYRDLKPSELECPGATSGASVRLPIPTRDQPPAQVRLTRTMRRQAEAWAQRHQEHPPSPVRHLDPATAQRNPRGFYEAP